MNEMVNKKLISKSVEDNFIYKRHAQKNTLNYLKNPQLISSRKKLIVLNLCSPN